jgi:hypothetical protein
LRLGFEQYAIAVFLSRTRLWGGEGLGARADEWLPGLFRPDYSGREDRLSGGARKIPVTTPAGEYRVWVKRVGNNPDLRVLLLHGGPGDTHEYLEAVSHATCSA